MRKIKNNKKFNIYQCNPFEEKILQLSDEIRNMIKAKDYEGMSKILILYGKPGISKTTKVNEILSQQSLKYAFLGGNLKKVSDMYKLLYANNDKDVIVFDDSEFPIRKNSPFLGMLKSALDRRAQRKITYIDDRDKQIKTTNNPRGKYKQSFYLNSLIIFITNLAMSKIDTNLLDRSIVIELSGTPDDIFYMINLEINKYNTEIPLNIKKDALSFLIKNFKTYEKMNFRIYQDVLFTRLFHESDWEKRSFNKLYDKINAIG